MPALALLDLVLLVHLIALFLRNTELAFSVHALVLTLLELLLLHTYILCLLRKDVLSRVHLSEELVKFFLLVVQSFLGPLLLLIVLLELLLVLRDCLLELLCLVF
jgi:hypothetical protein